MKLRLLQVLAIASIALYLVPTGAHFFEMANKLALSPADYMTVQKIYAGWSLFAIVIAVALASTLAHAVLARGDRAAFMWSLVAFLGLAATQVIFWMFTYPVNLASRNWTVQPEPFEAARRQWEYSHAASAALTFASLMAIVMSCLAQRSASER
jgi:hypothetical protein